MASTFDRRSFLRFVVAGGVLGAFDWLLPSRQRARAARPRGGSGVVAFRRSGRKRHVSKAAKYKNANSLYASFQAAADDLAHPGDRSRVVPVIISATLFQTFFSDGKSKIDLRKDLRTFGDFRALNHCMTGPIAGLRPGCEPADQDANGHADLRDYAALQRSFTDE